MITHKKFKIRLYDAEDKSIPKDAVHINAPSTYANPFVFIGKHADPKTIKDRRACFESFVEYCKINTYVSMSAKRHLRGKDLYCDCPSCPWHGEFIMECANG